MLKKLFLIFFIFFILYLMLVFKTPWTADILWNKEFNNFVRSFKPTLDDTSTNIPWKDDITGTFTKTYSWAIKLKNDIVSWVEKTKDTIDSVRSTLSWAENTYNDAIDKIEDVKGFVNDAWKKVEQVKGTLEDFDKMADSIKWMVNTWAVY